MNVPVAIGCNREFRAVQYGSVNVTQDSAGLVALYVCEDGSTGSRTCQPNATWSLPIPSCGPGMENELHNSCLELVGERGPVTYKWFGYTFTGLSTCNQATYKPHTFHLLKSIRVHLIPGSKMIKHNEWLILQFF